MNIFQPSIGVLVKLLAAGTGDPLVRRTDVINWTTVRTSDEKNLVDGLRELAKTLFAMAQLVLGQFAFDSRGNPSSDRLHRIQRVRAKWVAGEDRHDADQPIVNE